MIFDLAYPTIVNVLGMAPDIYRVYRAGSSLVRARFPEAPMITMVL